MRLIDANALIEKCGDWYVEEGTESGFIGTLKNLLATEPTVQPDPQWIPVSERLPEGYADVLCCNKYSDMMIGMIYENSASDTRFSVESDAEIMHDVIAWMPLPEPYKSNNK